VVKGLPASLRIRFMINSESLLFGDFEVFKLFTFRLCKFNIIFEY
jgi:hypothetical protein